MQNSADIDNIDKAIIEVVVLLVDTPNFGDDKNVINISDFILLI